MITRKTWSRVLVDNGRLVHVPPMWRQWHGWPVTRLKQEVPNVRLEPA